MDSANAIAYVAYVVDSNGVIVVLVNLSSGFNLNEMFRQPRSQYGHI